VKPDLQNPNRWISLLLLQSELRGNMGHVAEAEGLVAEAVVEAVAERLLERAHTDEVGPSPNYYYSILPLLVLIVINYSRWPS